MWCFCYCGRKSRLLLTWSARANCFDLKVQGWSGCHSNMETPFLFKADKVPKLCFGVINEPAKFMFMFDVPWIFSFSEYHIIEHNYFICYKNVIFPLMFLISYRFVLRIKCILRNFLHFPSKRCVYSR